MALGINHNIPGINANRMLLGTSNRMSGALSKLSSGLRINKAKDGPADLIISELLRSQLGGLERAVRNTQEANNVLGIAEGGLTEVSNTLRDMRSLALHALHSGITSPNQVSADQAELNGMLGAIANMAATTSYAGQNLLNGSQAVLFSAQDTSGMIDVGASRIDEVADIAGQQVQVQFAGGAANQAEKAYVETDFGGAATALTSDQEFIVTGEGGSREFSFAAGTELTDVADAINAQSESLGVTAHAVGNGAGGQELRLVSNAYGSDQAVQVQQVEGDAFAAEGETVRDTGQNATVTVDGQALTTRGLELNVDNDTFSGTLVLNEGEAAGTTVAQTGYDQDIGALVDAADSRQASLGDIEGGMRFQLGEGAGTQERTVFSLGSFDPSNIGRVNVNGEVYSLADLSSGSAASLANDPAAALKVIDQAIADVSGARARIGAYQANTLQTNVNSLNVAIENVTSTESAIRDADMARSVSEFVKLQILQKSGLMGVQSANMNAQNVLQLLGG